MFLEFIVSKNAPVQVALEKMGSNLHGIVFVEDNLKLVGSISDGDIRRFLVANGTLPSTLLEVMRKEPFSLSETEYRDNCFNVDFNEYSVVPVVDSSNVIINFLTQNSRSIVPIAQPKLGGREIDYVLQCLRSGWISSQGSFVESFEQRFADFIGAPPDNALAVSNGTVAIELGLRVLGVGPGDEVIVPNLTFAATANAVINVGAIPVLCDVDADDWCLSPEFLLSAISDRTRAVICVHLYGQSAKIKQISEIAIANGLFLLEDCAEALGTFFNNQHVGTFGDCATFSFFANKLITTGEGGMLVFRESKHADMGRILRSHGMSTKIKYWHELVGGNFRMTNIQGGIGLAQLEQIDFFLGRRIEIAQLYTSIFEKLPQITHIPRSLPHSINSFWLYSISMVPAVSVDKLINYCLSKGIQLRRCFYPLDHMPAFCNLRKTEVDNSQLISRSSISLPTYV
ncbi:aminotransferase class I/II-fold pyridoxal phosphate-dependent enzyme, partial [Litorivicinus sp.]|nr:aminotransferase class I/II-fold pyridoxal phosphate-dependent enzyme [Litorivicinus sp.]